MEKEDNGSILDDVFEKINKGEAPGEFVDFVDNLENPTFVSESENAPAEGAGAENTDKTESAYQNENASENVSSNQNEGARQAESSYQSEETTQNQPDARTREELLAEIDSLKDKVLRGLAESENIRTRAAKSSQEAREYAIFSFAKDLVPVIDNLSRALEHLPENLSDDTKNIVEGVKMTKQELESAFKKHSLDSISPHSGDKFDYNLHHAISQIVTEDQEEGTIVNTMQMGYKIKNRLIRPAAVVVAKGS
ncbi:MAG: nucleotide exchange factor GrpE [Rickettsiales bacterium]|nr:MAG: nucleotide exchange factor GrpE [Rickettsiales bacterium]